MKKFLIAASVLALSAIFAACGSDDGLGDVLVISREAGSGARGAFEEMADVQDIVSYSQIGVGSNGVLTTVEQNPSAIGYVTYGLIGGRGVRAIPVDGVPFSGAAALDGSYPFAIGFHMAYHLEDISEAARTFIDWVASPAGQAVVTNNEYVPTNPGATLGGGNSNGGTIVVAGSTTVTPVAQALADAFMAAHPGYIVEVQGIGTGGGMTATAEGTAHVGLASRNLNAGELETLGYVTFAIDGLAVIVHEDNDIAGLTFDQVQAIFRGELTEWSDLD